MGNRSSSNPHAILENENRRYFVSFKSRRLIGEGVLSYVVFTFTVRFQRYSWDINFRFHDVVKLDRILLREFPEEMSSITRPSKHNKIFFTHDQRFLAVREKLLNKYLQDVLDSVQNDHFLPLRIFMESSCVSFCPDFGRKGKEGWLKKCSGGYHQGFSRKTGDYISVWTWRWFVLVDNCIVWMKNPSDPTVYGSMQLDQSFSVSRTGRVISITNATRRLLLFAQTTRSAEEWELAFRNFFYPSPKLFAQVHRSTYPVRDNCHVNAYTLPRDYYQSLAMALLSAQKEIFIASWKNSPTVLLTRPPLPPIRLDQLLKFKADQGVQIYILLYKEVEHIGQGNDSAGAKKKLEGLSPNIHVIRHPNKFLGGSTALLWSHHEKLVVIDRSSAYVGGIDLAFQRWDDENHRLADEDGILFPGNDYRQPSPGVFKPARNILEEGDADPLFDDGMVEVEVNQEENLPVALSALADDDELYEVQVVVDFNDLGGGAFPTAPSATATNLSPSSAASTSSAPPLNSYGAASAPHSSTHQHPAKQASSPPDDDDVESATWEEDRDVGTTAEERQALQAQGINVDTSDPNKLMASDSFTSRGSIISSMSSSISASRESIHASLNNISDHFRFYAERAQTALQAYVDEVQTKKRIQKSNLWETRDQYPRMPWHDLQVGVTGRVARDAASHFLQRWNHHRLSTSDYAQPVLHDITDDTLFTVCARCQHSQIIESASSCPRCQYDLGPVNSFSTPESVLYQPIPPSRYSYIVFTCTYSMEKKLPMRMEGDCPVVVTRVLNQQSYGGLLQRTQAVDEFGRPIDTQSLEDAEQNDREGYLVDVCGSEAEWLQAFGLYPARGDVVMEVNGVAVTHLNSHQLKRLISRHRRGLCQLGGEAASSSSSPDALRITFRRHYIEGMQPLDKKEDEGVDGDLLPNKADDAAGTAPTVIVSVLGSDAVVAEGSVKVPAAPPAAPLDSASMLAAKQAAMGVGATAVAPSLHPPAPTVVAASVSSSSPNAVAMSDSDRSTPPLTQRRASTASPTAVTPSSAVAKATAKSPAAAAEVFHPICSAAAHRESALSISHFFHDFKRYCEPMPRVIDEQGTCRVQLLRSVGKWSVGTSNVESSIQNAYIECIQQAKHFIYIENQFFVSSTAGSDVQNGVVNALIDRISEAFQNQQVFRVIVIIPMHPNGDFCNALKAKCVMHYEYATINRGMHSMFGRLTRMCPGITISDFVSFYSLRNWGVLNNKVYSEQIYVHDKLLIVDDRVAIIGSANINDRSMLGSRDSEVAVKIEDTLEIETRFNGSVVTVGYMPHMLRLKLMKQHLRDESIDVADIVGNEGYRLWRSIATHNSSVYDELDGQMSFYRCTSITDYRAALQAHLPRSILDSETQQSLSEIRGFIVDWPQQFLSREDLAPSYATRAMIPNELWV